ncbi:MAG: hypothetical protein V1839_03050 [archaeon]
MSRKPGYDKVKVETILYALRTSPHGSWVRDIAKKTGLKKSTVAHYLKEHLSDKIEVVHDSKHIKIIKLKESAKEKPKEKPEKPSEKKAKPAAKQKEDISEEDIEDMVGEGEQEPEEEVEEIPDYIG